MAEVIRKQSRYDYIDIAKALGMLTIMWGHIAVGKSITFVYAFHIPLFFFLSGMVFVKDKYPCFGAFVKRRIQTLIIPYFIYSFITWAIWASFSYITHAHVESYWMPLLQTFIAQGSEGYLVHNVPLWFVSCLFVVELGYYWLSKLPDFWNLSICIMLAVLSFVLVNKCSFFDFTVLPWSIEVAMAAILFYACGHLLIKHLGHQRVEQIVNARRGLSLIVIIVAFILVYYGGLFNGKVSMGHAIIHNPFVFYPIAILGTMASISLSTLIANSIINTWKWMNGLRWFGQNSFIAMSIHNPIKGFIIVALASLLGVSKMDVMKSIWIALGAFLCTLLATVVIMQVIVHYKSRRTAKQ